MSIGLHVGGRKLHRNGSSEILGPNRCMFSANENDALFSFYRCDCTVCYYRPEHNFLPLTELHFTHDRCAVAYNYEWRSLSDWYRQNDENFLGRGDAPSYVLRYPLNLKNVGPVPPSTTLEMLLSILST